MNINIKNNTTFTKWFLVNAVVLTMFVLAEQKGAVTTIIKNDLSHLSIVIMILYVLVSGVVGKFCFLADKLDENTLRSKKEKLLKRADVGWFAAEHFFSLGLLGTILGLTIATQTSLTDTGTISEVVSGLKMGLNTAFYTTICGIVFSIPLQVQLMILKYKLEE